MPSTPQRPTRRRFVLAAVVASAIIAGTTTAVAATAPTGPVTLDGTVIGAPAAQVVPSSTSGHVLLRVGDDLPARVAAAAPGTKFVVAPGVHRLDDTIEPKDGMVFRGQPGAVLSGAKVLSGWQRDAQGRWSVDGQTQEAPTSGTYGSGDWRDGHYAEPGHEQEVFRGEELFVDGRRLRHVNTLADVDAPGEWFFDHAADRITVFDDPRGRLVETSVTPYAFAGPGVRDVVIEDLEIRHFATRIQRAPINGKESLDWTVRRVWSHHNHAGGIYVGPGMTVEQVRLTDNGQIGISGNGELDASRPIVVRDSEIAHNAVLGYDDGFESGGTKFAKTRGMVFENNWVHHNGAKGVWFDIDNHGATIRWNLVEQNASHGIFYEISYAARITENVVRHNGRGENRWPVAGIYVVDSSDVEVDRNLVYGEEAPFLASHQDRKTLTLGPTGVRGLWVHDNDFTIVDKAPGLYTTSSAVTDPWTAAAGNRFDRNTYRLGNSGARWWWNDDPGDFAEWRSHGHDRNGRVVASGTPGPFPGRTIFAPSAYGPRG